MLKHQDKLKDEELRQVLIMLNISPTLSTAYFLKELLYSILDETDPNKQKQFFSDWIEEASESDIPSFVKCAKTYYNWFTPIFLSLHKRFYRDLQQQDQGPEAKRLRFARFQAVP